MSQIVRRGGGRSEKSVVRWRRVLVVQASAGDNTGPVIAKLVSTSEDLGREMIHRFNEMGGIADPQWAGAVPAGSRLRTRASSWRRPQPGARPSGGPSPSGAAQAHTHSADNDHESCSSGGNDSARSSTPTRSPCRGARLEGVQRPHRDAKVDRIDHVLEHHPTRAKLCGQSTNDAAEPPGPAAHVAGPAPCNGRRRIIAQRRGGAARRSAHVAGPAPCNGRRRIIAGAM